MLKREHFDESGERFSPTSFLLDKHPGKYIRFKELNIKKEKYSCGLLLNMFSLIDDIGSMTRICYRNYCNKDYSFIMNMETMWNTILDKKYVARINMYYTQDFNIGACKNLFKEIKHVVVKDINAKFRLIGMSKTGPEVIIKSLKQPVLLESDDYNISCDFNTLMSDITSEDSGLIILAGDPGTGKSNLIKYAAQQNPDKKFFFLSNSNLHILSDPSFTKFCLHNLQDAVLVLEDCEKALLSRDFNKGFDISNILNITDGIVGDMLNIKIIATLNTYDKIDPALLRKGRLIRKVEFKKLKAEQVRKLADRLNKNIPNAEEMTLCEVYNTDANGIENTVRLGIGFNN